MDIGLVPGVEWGDDPVYTSIVIDLTEFCAWLDMPCNMENANLIRAVVERCLEEMAVEVVVEAKDVNVLIEGVLS